MHPLENYNCIVVLGPTASGKTHTACRLAYALDGEIISADSRQVYRRLDIGTGKDLEEYQVNGKAIPYHLIDIVEPGEQFYLHEFAAALKKTFGDISAQKKIPIICGGTGLYLDALRKDFSFTQVKEDPALRLLLEPLSKEELIRRLQQYPETFFTHVDLSSRKRIIRGIEVAAYFSRHGRIESGPELPYKPCYLGIKTDTEQRKALITQRLEKRLKEGLIEEVEGLLRIGITHERLQFLGLEYKYISDFLRAKISGTELFLQLQTAIFQFAKRQMTWFRRMEREGVKIHWIERDADLAFITEKSV